MTSAILLAAFLAIATEAQAVNAPADAAPNVCVIFAGIVLFITLMTALMAAAAGLQQVVLRMEADCKKRQDS